MIQLRQGSEPGISRRIELVTRFNVSGEKYASENFKVMNYGLGGTIQKHWDSTGNFSSKLDKNYLLQFGFYFFEKLQTMQWNLQNMEEKEY